MIFKPTEQQRLAISPEHSVWVTANAGTGKTRILTGRVLRLMLEGVSPKNIVCITFTKAAANEMRERINDTLLKWMKMPEQDVQAHLAVLLDKPNIECGIIKRVEALFCEVIDHPDALSIKTIHSLCQSILKQFPLEFDTIQSHFEVAESLKEKEMLLLAKQRLLLGLADSVEHDERLKHAVHYIASNHSQSIFFECFDEMVQKRDKFQRVIDEHGGVNLAINYLYDLLAVSPETTFDSVIEDFFSREFYRSIILQELVTLLKEETLGKSDQKFLVGMVSWLKIAEEQRIHSYERYIALFLTQKGEVRKKILTQKIAKIVPDSIMCFLEEEAQRVFKLTQQLANVRMLKQTEALLHVAEALLSIYQKIKDEEGLMDNNDLVLKTVELLEKSDFTPWVLFKLDQKIEHLLVDEAQDTSPLQWKIIYALCSDFFTGEGAHTMSRSLFVVGDEKQSIYSFQGADSIGFAASKKIFQEQAAMSKSAWQNITMNRSFRSSSAVLQLVDRIYARDIYHQAVSYGEEKITHEVHRADAYGKVEIWPLITEEEDEELSDEDIWEPLMEYKQTSHLPHKAANEIASRIARWFKENKILRNQGRKIEPRDILILVQRRNDFVYYLTNALSAQGLPVAGVDRMVLNDHIAVEDMIALGEWLLMPDDDLVLATLLKSPLFNFTEDELFHLVHDRGEKTVWSIICERSEENNKLNYCFKLLNYLSDIYINISIFDVYSYVIDVQNIRYNYTQRMGSEVHDVLNEYLFMVQRYESSEKGTLQAFIEWIKHNPVQIKRDSDTGNNEIRITTVHGAKGLQSPIVILPDTVRQRESDRDKILWNFYDLMPYCFWGTHCRESPFLQRMKEEQKEKNADENLRLLYVALTRAEDELYIAGYNKKDNVSSSQWYSIARDAVEEFSEEASDDGSFRFECHANDHESANVTTQQLDDIESAHEEDKFVLPDVIPVGHASCDREYEDDVTMFPETAQIKKGIFIHKMLELLPAIPFEKHKFFIEAHARSNHFSNIDTLVAEVVSVTHDPDFNFFFTGESYAEIEVSYEEGNILKKLVIDRLVIDNGVIYIVDFKTSEKEVSSSEVPHQYVEQLNLYRREVQKIYPDHDIRCVLLWTYSLTLQFIE